jgi:hypothetical protein
MTADFLVIIGLVLVPGLGAALALAPAGEISIEARTALAVGLGYATAAGTALLLALAHVFHRPVYIAALLVVTAGLWVLALRGNGWLGHLAGFRAQARAAPTTTVLNLAFLLAVAFIWVGHSAVPNLDRRSAWRYWSDGLEIAAAGQVPRESRQWGMEIPTTIGKVALNAFEAGVSSFNGPDPLSGMRAILLVTAVGLVGALLALGRELGLGIFSALVPALAVLVPAELPFAREMSIDLMHFTAENVGRMTAVCGMVVAIYAARVERRGPVVVAGLLLAIAALTHAIPMAIACVMLGFYALGLVLLERKRWRGVLLRAFAILAVVGAVYVAVVGLSGGRLGFEGAARAKFSGLPANVDPTRSFAQGRYLPAVPKHGHFVTPPRRLVRAYAGRIFDASGQTLGAVAFMAALLAASVWAVYRNRLLLPLATLAWGLFVTLLAGAFFFSYRYKTQVPGHFGLWRLFDYAVLIPALLVPAILYEGAKLLRSLRWARIAVVVFVIAAAALVAALSYIRQDGQSRRGLNGLRVMKAVAAVVPCDARMLANARTAGSWEALTGRRALTEGRAPFLDPGVMVRVLSVLDGATRFFDDPSMSEEYLDRERVDYVVVVSPGIWFGWGGGGRRPTREDADAVAALPDVDEVYRDARVAVFAVGPAAARAEGEQPARCDL